MRYITRACPYCGETIVVDEGGNIPPDIIMTQGRNKKMVTLAHLKCAKEFRYADTDSVRN